MVRDEIAQFAAACRTHPRLAGSTDLLLGAALPPARRGAARPDEPARACWRRTASIRSCTSRSAPTCAPAASAWPRTACRPARVIEDVGRERRDRLAAAGTADADVPPLRRSGPGRGRGGRAGPGRRGRQPLDPRGRRGQGPAPLLPLPRPLPQLHRGPPGQGPPRGGRSSAPTCPTSSPPAT